MKDIVRKIIGNRWLTCISRVALGSIFITASIGKLQDHGRFIDTVVNYDMLPDFLAHAYGFIVPWAELFIGCCLILGVFVRFASLLSIPIVFSFIVANIYSMLHTSPEICDCFGNLVALSHPVSLGIDIVMLVLAGQLWLNNRSGEFLSIGPLIYGLSIGLGGAKRFLFEKGSMFTMVVLAMALLALFAPDIYGEPDANLSISVSPSGGGSVMPVPRGYTYESGTVVILTAIPADGYTFSHWSGGASGYTTSVTITMDSDKIAIAHFTSIIPTYMYTLAVTVSPPYGGTVQIDPLQDSYEPGSEVTLTATLNSSSYTFEGWQMGSVSLGNENPITITMDSDKEINAVILCGG